MRVKHVVMTVGLALMLAISVPQESRAATTYPCPRLVEEMQEAAMRGAKNDIEGYRALKQSRVDRIKQNMANCIDKYKNIKFGSTFGLPDLSGLVLKALESATSMVCNKIDESYNDITQSVGSKVMLPNGWGGANIGLPKSGELKYPSSQQPAVSTGVIDVKTKTAPTNIPKMVRDIFK